MKKRIVTLILTTVLLGGALEGCGDVSQAKTQAEGLDKKIESIDLEQAKTSSNVNEAETSPADLTDTAQEEDGWPEYEAAKKKADERNEDGNVVYNLNGYTITYSGKLEVNHVQSEAGEGNKGIISICAQKSEDSRYGIGIYSKKFNAKGYKAIIKKGHQHTDVNGHVYYTAEDNTENVVYYAFPDRKQFLVVQFTDDMPMDDIQIDLQ